jgi:hypothetical protein
MDRIAKLCCGCLRCWLCQLERLNKPVQPCLTLSCYCHGPYHAWSHGSASWRIAGTALSAAGGVPLTTVAACRNEIVAVIRQQGGQDFNLMHVNFNFGSANALRNCEQVLRQTLPWVRTVPGSCDVGKAAITEKVQSGASQGDQDYLRTLDPGPWTLCFLIKPCMECW